MSMRLILGLDSKFWENYKSPTQSPTTFPAFPLISHFTTTFPFFSLSLSLSSLRHLRSTTKHPSDRPIRLSPSAFLAGNRSRHVGKSPELLNAVYGAATFPIRRHHSFPLFHISAVLHRPRGWLRPHPAPNSLSFPRLVSNRLRRQAQPPASPTFPTPLSQCLHESL